MSKKKRPSASRRNAPGLDAKSRAQRVRDEKHRTLVFAAVLLGLLIALIVVAVIQSRDTSQSPRANSPLVPAADLARGEEWTLSLETNRGDIVLSLDGEHAPQATSVLLTLVHSEFYSGTDCHRIRTEEPFFVQCGSPDGTASGGPPYRFGPVENAPDNDVYPAGSVVMVRTGSDEYSMGSQFFIVYKDSVIETADGHGYTVVGHVVEGLDIVIQVAEGGTITGASDGAPAHSVILTKVTTS